MRRFLLVVAVLPAGCSMAATVKQELPPIMVGTPPPVASVEAKL